MVILLQWVAQSWLLRFFGLEEGGHEILFSDLHSLVFFGQSPNLSSKLFFYHQSFSEFLVSKTRAKDMFVSPKRVKRHVVDSCFQHLLRQDFQDSRKLPAPSPTKPLTNPFTRELFLYHERPV